MPHKIQRSTYADIYGPTTGDKVRLGDTSLVLQVEKDLAVYGDECKFGGGKTIREGMGQAAGVGDKDALDCVITNALIVDWTGIRKADVGIKNGRIAGIGKAGNPDIMAGVDAGMIVGVTTEAIAGEGLILTAGAIDAHIHFICPQQVFEALAEPPWWHKKVLERPKVMPPDRPYVQPQDRPMLPASQRPYLDTLLAGPDPEPIPSPSPAQWATWGLQGIWLPQ